MPSGARWDGRQSTWYVPDGIDSAPFKRWLPESQTPNVRAPRWGLAVAPRECWRCGKITLAFAVMLPPGHEVLIEEDDPAEDRWERGERSVLLSYLAAVPASVVAQLRMLSSHYRLDYSRTTGSFYWMNHCEHCEAKLGDFETIAEPGTFYELGPGLDERRLIIEGHYQFAEPFSGRCGSHADVE
jgi:hypothetical protein